jgi:hypothetical protein
MMFQVFRLIVDFGVGPAWYLQAEFATLAEARAFAQSMPGMGHIIRHNDEEVT